jgi:hypothetical protein
MGLLLELLSPVIMMYYACLFVADHGGQGLLPHHIRWHHLVAKLTGGWHYVFGFATLFGENHVGDYVWRITWDIITVLISWYMLGGWWRVCLWVNRYLPACYKPPSPWSFCRDHAERIRLKEWLILFVGAQLLWVSALRVGSLFTTTLDHSLAPP